MPGTIEHLPLTSSPLGRWDPRWKLAAFLTLGCCLFLLHRPAINALALGSALLLAAVGRLPLRWVLGRLGLVLLVLAPFLLLLPFVQKQAEPAWQLGPLRFSLPGLWAALVLGLKTLTLTLLVLILLITAPLPATFKAAQALHVPGLLVQLALLTYRYIFVLANELARLRVALRVRGYRNRPNLHCYRTAGHVTGTLLVRGYEQAERVEQAMRCRGFDGRFRTLNDFQTQPRDVLGLLAAVAGAVLLVALDRGWLWLGPAA